MKQICAFIASLSIITFLFGASTVFVVQPQTAFAATTSKEAACQAINGTAGCTKDNADLTNILKLVINVMSVIIGFIAVVMIIVAGFKYVTSSGDSNKLTAAKNSLVYAIIGLIIVALAQFMVRVVLRTANDVTKKNSTSNSSGTSNSSKSSNSTP